MTDTEILDGLRKGSPIAFEEVFNRYHAKVYHFVLSCLFDKSLAQDLTQSVFLSVWEHRAGIDPSRNFNAYLYTIAQNYVYRHTERMLLSVRYREHLMQHANPVATEEIEEELDYRLLEKYIWELIDQLPPARKEIFTLSRKNGLTNKEIALRLSISEKTVEAQITRSIHFLKKHVKPHVALMGLLIFGL